MRKTFPDRFRRFKMKTFFERSVMAVALTAAVTAGYLAVERSPQAAVTPAGGDAAAMLAPQDEALPSWAGNGKRGLTTNWR